MDVLTMLATRQPDARTRLSIVPTPMPALPMVALMTNAFTRQSIAQTTATVRLTHVIAATAIAFTLRFPIAAWMLPIAMTAIYALRMIARQAPVFSILLIAMTLTNAPQMDAFLQRDARTLR